MRLAKRSALALLGSASMLGAAASPAAADFEPPQVAVKQGINFKLASTLSDNGKAPSLSTQIKWTAYDPDGICSQRVALESYDVNWNYKGTAHYSVGTAARTLTVSMNAGDYVYAYVYASDCAGNGEGSAYAIFRPKLAQESAATYSAGWSTGSCTCWSLGSVLRTSTAGAKATYRFTGSSVAVVMPKAANRGLVDVYVNGVFKKTVNLYSATSLNRVVVWETAYATSAARTVELRATGGKQIDVDAFLVN